MVGSELPYFKFVCALIDAGIWAKMSPAARTLYPVLLRFSDKHFSPVYPGTKKLLELTGFKQKASLRKARKELISLGLISITLGQGRKNTIYHFRFDWIQPTGISGYPSEVHRNTPLRNKNVSLRDARSAPKEGHPSTPPYNEIHISINQGVPRNPVFKKKKEKANTDPLKELKKIYGEKEVEKAIYESRIAGLPVTPETIEKILKGKVLSAGENLEELLSLLENKISTTSLHMIKKSFLRQENGYLVFSEELPLYLKTILLKFSERILFEADRNNTNFVLREEWRQYE